VWFSRGLARAAGSEQGQEIRAPIEERLDRFFAELARDRRLSSLAGNPLLLVGLIALSVRQIALPRNRMQAIQSLVAILLETHPEHRATAAGDTMVRFVHIPEVEHRRAALGRLAFVARSASGGGTYDIKEARRAIRDYLADATTFAYAAERAQNAASEMLAVNAETVGLLAERAPGEVGFAHAVFEEYLAAEHIQRWTFPEITTFARERSGDPLWRNVISNLVSLLARPTEVESVVLAIETAPADEASREGAISRDVLLADIAFNSSRKPPATAQRLVDRAFDIIERGDWMSTRREVLKAALTSVGETTSPTPVDDRLASWMPRREKYLSDLFNTLGGWKPAPDLRDVLLKGIHETLARVYENDAEIRRQILSYANPLPATPRGDIAEAASAEANGRPAFERVLEGYDIEVDGELKIAASIYYHRNVARRTNGLPADHLKKLANALRAVGPDLYEPRAAAFAGMLLIGRVNDIAPMTDYGDKPMHIPSGTGYGHESDSLMALMCERWEDVRQAFGADLAARFGNFGADDGHLWDCLAPHINASVAARRDFLAFCNETDTTLGLRSFVALAREQPSSDLLLEHCWRVFGREVAGTHERHSAWAVERLRLEIAYILRDQFRDKTDVKGRLREVIKRGQRVEVVALALVEPTVKSPSARTSKVWSAVFGLGHSAASRIRSQRS
jgi:hypothetical protein